MIYKPKDNLDFYWEKKEPWYESILGIVGLVGMTVAVWIILEIFV